MKRGVGVGIHFGPEPMRLVVSIFGIKRMTLQAKWHIWKSRD